MTVDTNGGPHVAKKTYFSRHSKGGGAMIWVVISSESKMAFCVIVGTLNKVVYTEFWQNYMLPFASGKHGTKKNDFIFM